MGFQLTRSLLKCEVMLIYFCITFTTSRYIVKANFITFVKWLPKNRVWTNKNSEILDQNLELYYLRLNRTIIDKHSGLTKDFLRNETSKRVKFKQGSYLNLVVYFILNKMHIALYNKFF